jgi:hypothetical protein
MTYILKNKTLEIHVDGPFENYNFSRFDWTGKIVNVKFHNIPLSSIEKINSINETILGKGFYNEFGIDTALGFNETELGGWFHKIGIGLLKKDGLEYQFNKSYEIKPAKFEVNTSLNRVTIYCTSETVNGYSYLLRKIIELHEDGFSINYYLQNTGKKTIITDEYNHNFTSINNDSIGPNYVLKFPFQLKPKLFGETVNPELKIEIGHTDISFTNSIDKEFFFSNLSGNEQVHATWELIHSKSKIGISERVSFQTDKVNLWGCKHVICPELFHKIVIKPSELMEWSRHYKVYKTPN